MTFYDNRTPSPSGSDGFGKPAPTPETVEAADAAPTTPTTNGASTPTAETETKPEPAVAAPESSEYRNPITGRPMSSLLSRGSSFTVVPEALSTTKGSCPSLRYFRNGTMGEDSNDSLTWCVWCSRHFTADSADDSDDRDSDRSAAYDQLKNRLCLGCRKHATPISGKSNKEKKDGDKGGGGGNRAFRNVIALK
ncbi:hypothetical protein MKZ38_003982 [Zalerion maritima]|uniref:Uncharacterized protein n=1 Tax=Zalerion maritima TaxID=339359 RepID=A0AAD5RMY5_9PEZI|nr:hypothetical protein MKZ38_003982 [Zalerion maritima]